MCGISVVINGTAQDAITMGTAIKHRGTRHNLTSIGNIHVYFSQLAITDLKAPAQPYVSGRYHVWLNGYISNYKELAMQYDIDMWTDCDTQFLAGFIGKFHYYKLRELNGFFSIVVWDDQAKTVTLKTDRHGIKQLYTYVKGDGTDTIYVCSEVKGILAISNPKLSDRAVQDWMYSLGVMTMDTIYSGINRVEGPIIKTPDPIDISYEDACTKVSELLTLSFWRNKINHINDGVFLSGGVDSGIIAKWMQPKYSFSMDYKDKQFSEADNIKLNSTGIHYSMICNEEMAREYADKTLLALDDFKVGSCYTNFALTELASKHCTVLYSGAGADELFDGYEHRYNKPIREVIRRTDAKYPSDQPEPTHKEYDWAYLRGILVVEDRMAGYHTMETRYPYLDNDLVNFVLSLPAEYRKNKRILKDVSGLPKEITEGKKRGFSNPYFTNLEWAEFCLKKVQ